MKLNANKEKLLDTLQIAIRACAAGKTMPVLQCVKIEATADNRVTMSATDLDRSLSASFPADVKEAGSVLIEAKRFASIVAALAGVDVAFSKAQNYTLTVKAGPSKFRLMGMDGGEFPRFERPKESIENFKLSQADLAALLGSVRAAQSKDEARYHMNAVSVERNGSKVLHFVATDGRRLHFTARDVEGREDASWNAVLPRESVGLLCGLLSETGGVSVGFTLDRAIFVIDREDGEIVFVTKLVAGKFPDWRRVTAGFEDRTAITVSRKDLLSAISRARLMISEKDNAVRFTVEGMMLSLFAQNNEGEAAESIACENPKNVIGRLAVNSSYLIDALHASEDEKIVLRLDAKSAESNPLGIEAASGPKAVVMPIRYS